MQENHVLTVFLSTGNYGNHVLKVHYVNTSKTAKMECRGIRK